MNKVNHWPKWAFAIFGGLLVIINAALTFSFGFSYLGRSFGSGVLSDYVGAFYALLIFDAAYLSWFYTYLRTAESTGQRSLALLMAGFSLVGSLTATLQQLVTNATGLIDLGAYHQAVGLGALAVMVFMTSAHIISTAFYIYLDPREKVRQMRAIARGNALDDSLEGAQRLINIDHSQIVSQMAQEVRADVLGSLGFTHDVKHITAPAQIEAKLTTPAAIDATQPLPVVTKPTVMAAESPTSSAPVVATVDDAVFSQASLLP